MKTIKKFSSLLALIMFFSIIPATTSTTAYVAPDIPEKVDCEFVIESFASNQIINESITQRGVSWQHPYGYNVYRVWVNNTTNQTMTVTVKSNGGTHTSTVPANSSKTVFIVNNAWEVEHTIDFQTASGYVSGTVSVRVSDTDL